MYIMYIISLNYFTHLQTSAHILFWDYFHYCRFLIFLLKFAAEQQTNIRQTLSYIVICQVDVVLVWIASDHCRTFFTMREHRWEVKLELKLLISRLKGLSSVTDQLRYAVLSLCYAFVGGGGVKHSILNMF